VDEDRAECAAHVASKEWIISRRFREFDTLHQSLSRQFIFKVRQHSSASHTTPLHRTPSDLTIHPAPSSPSILHPPHAPHHASSLCVHRRLCSPPRRLWARSHTSLARRI
jgi:hypothetical protein